MRSPATKPPGQGGPRPWKPTKTCSACGTTFPTRYEWRQHDRHACFDAIAGRMSSSAALRLMDIERGLLLGYRDRAWTNRLPFLQPYPIPEAQPRPFDLARDFGGRLRYQPKAVRDEDLLEDLLRVQRELGPPPPRLFVKPMPEGIVPKGEVWIMGDAETLNRAFGRKRRDDDGTQQTPGRG